MTSAHKVGITIVMAEENMHLFFQAEKKQVRLAADHHILEVFFCENISLLSLDISAINPSRWCSDDLLREKKDPDAN